MICENCGFSNETNNCFCTQCGSSLTAHNTTSLPHYYASPQAIPNETSESGKGLAIAGMVCGITSFFLFRIILGILGIVFGAVSRSQGCKSNMAIVGIICGSLSIIIRIFFFINSAMSIFNTMQQFSQYV